MRLFFLAMIGLLANAIAQAEPGITPTQIVIGQSAAFTGPAGQLGLNMNAGAKVYFKLLNERGGVHGRTIELKTRDDGYEATRAAANTRALIEQDKVFALFGYVGTPTSNAALPIFTEAKVPFFGAFTGADSLRAPFNRYIFNLRASYFDETERLVEHLVTTSTTRIAVFYQNDAYGKAGLEGVTRAMERRKLAVIASTTVERNSTDVAQAVAAMQAAKPDAIVQISAYASCAALIKGLRQTGYGGQFLNVSFVGSKALADALGKDGAGVIISQVVPSPWSEVLAVQREYLEAMKKAGTDDVNYGSMEGFLAAKVFVEGLRRAGENLTRERFIAALESMNEFDAGGFKISFGPQNHSASKFVDMTIIGSNGRFVR